MKKIKLRFYIMIIFVFIFSAFFINYKSTYGIYRDTLNTKVYLSVLDPSATATVTYISDNTTYDTDSFPVNSTIGVLPKPDKTGYNFIGWYTEDGTRKIGPNEIITGDVRFIAHWAKIVCKKVTNMNKLHTETCSSGGGCTVSGTGYSTSSNSNTITYGTIYDDNSPKVGDAYDCDVYYDDVFDIKDTSNVRYSERFYYIRKKDNQGSEPTAVLVYYTSVDENGRVDSTTTTNDVGAYTYNQAETYLPTSSTWDNPGLINFDGNGTVSRFITFDDLNAICGPVTTSTSYFKNCKKWFLFETSRFQSGSKARAGIWINKNNDQYYRIHTGSLNVSIPENGANSSNMVRPVIEIPFTQIDGYSEKNIYTISFETNDSNSSMPHITRYEDQKIGMLDVPPTREGYRFVGWFYDNNTFQNEVSQNDTVTGNTPIYAKWELDTVNLEYVFHIPGECTFNGDAAITSSSNNCISTVNHTNSNIDYTDNTNSEYNQTSNKYINTHVSLYNNDNYDKDYEVGFTIVDMDLSNEKFQASLFNTKLEYNDNNYNYPGLVFRIKSATHFEISQTSNKVNTKLPIQSSNITSASPVDVKIMRKSGVISYIFNGGQEKVVQTLSGDYDHFAFPAWFGAASQAAGLNDTTAGAFRYIKGTLSNMYIDQHTM